MRLENNDISAISTFFFIYNQIQNASCYWSCLTQKRNFVLYYMGGLWSFLVF